MNRASIVKLGLALLGVTWLFVVTFSFYVVHKPFTLETARAVLSALGDLVLAAAIFALAAALGRRLLRALKFASPLDALVFPTGIGLAALSFATLALGLLGLLSSLLFWLLLAAGLFLLRAELVSSWRDLCAQKLTIESRFEWALAAFCGLALLLALVLTLMPPTAWDAQTYHLVEAKTAIARGRIAAPPDNVYFSFPSLVEMIYLAAMLLKGDSVAAVIHFGFFALLLAAVFSFGKRYFNSRVAWLAVAILAAVPSLLSLATAPYVDIALAFYAFAAFLALVAASETNDWRWFALAGAFAGLALGVKYTAVIVPSALILVLLVERTSPVRGLVSLVVFTLLFAAPWYLRNLVFTGNPVYPFVFGGPYWDAVRADQFSRFGSGLVNAPLQILTAPWDATVFGTEGSASYDATIGPLLLALLPLLLLTFFGLRDRILNRLLVFAAILYLFWLVGLAESKLLSQTRLLFPAFPVLALAAAVAFDRLEMIALPQFSLQRFARLLVLMILGLTAFSYLIGFASVDPLPYLAGLESRDQFLSHGLGGYYGAIQFINRSLPSGSKTLFLWEPRSYYAQVAVQPDVLLDNWRDMRSRNGDANAIVLSWQRAGYTHVLLSRTGLSILLQSGYDPITSDDVSALEQVASQDLRQVYGKTPLLVITQDGKPALADAQTDPYAVYQIVPPGTAH